MNADQRLPKPIGSCIFGRGYFSGGPKRSGARRSPIPREQLPDRGAIATSSQLHQFLIRAFDHVVEYVC
jgi:hypothetical protein